MAALVEKVATKAGVSIATVSRVMNNNPNVSADKVKIVRQAIKDLNVNKALAKGSKALRMANTVAFVVTNKSVATSYSYILTETMHSAGEALKARGFNMLLTDIADGKEAPKILRGSNIAGMILSGDISDEQILTLIKDIPKVWVTSHYTEGHDVALAGNEAVGRLAAEYLISRGHKRAAVICPFSAEPYHSRCDFFQYTLMRNGIQIDSIVGNARMPVDDTKFNVEWFDKMSNELVEKFLQLPGKPTGLFIPNDTIAGTFYRSLNKRGIIPGKQFEIVSCGNDVAILSTLYPIPTTIDIGPKLMAERAVEQLLWRIENSEEERNFKAFIEPILIKSPDVTTDKFEPCG